MAQNRVFTSAQAASYDLGLRRYMLRVYNLMALGVALTGLVAFFIASSPSLASLVIGSPLRYVLFFGLIGMGFMAPRLIMTRSVATAQIVFWIYAGLWGALTAPFALIYTGQSIAKAFFITAIMFGGTSLYGYVTKRDLAPMGRFLMMAVMGLFAIIIFGVVGSLFTQGPIFGDSFSMLLSGAIVLVFAGLTAYETQAIKDSYHAGLSGSEQESRAILGALLLYGSFITIFIHVLSLIGVARSE